MYLFLFYFMNFLLPICGGVAWWLWSRPRVVILGRRGSNFFTDMSFLLNDDFSTGSKPGGKMVGVFQQRPVSEWTAKTCLFGIDSHEEARRRKGRQARQEKCIT